MNETKTILSRFIARSTPLGMAARPNGAGILAVVAALILCDPFGATSARGEWLESNDNPIRLSPAEVFAQDEVVLVAASEEGEAPVDEQPASDAPADESEDLAKKVANPISDLISFPIQSNFNFGGGIDLPPSRIPRPLLRLLPGPGARLAARLLTLPFRTQDRDQAFQYKLNVQPVIPISLNKDWNVISRTIVPIIVQDDVIGNTSQGGLGDITQSLFFSPKSGEPFLWGVGPVFLLPTSTDHNYLGAYRWGMGPTGVILKQSHGFTFGALANHIWSFARDDNRKEVNATFLQPFLTYTTKTATSFGIASESTYDWVGDQWTIPLIPSVSQIIKIGRLPVSLQLAGQYWVEKPDSGSDWGMRFQIQFLFPK